MRLLNRTTIAVASGCLGAGIFLGAAESNVNAYFASAFLVATAVLLGATK